MFVQYLQSSTFHDSPSDKVLSNATSLPKNHSTRVSEQEFKLTHKDVHKQLKRKLN